MKKPIQHIVCALLVLLTSVPALAQLDVTLTSYSGQAETKAGRSVTWKPGFHVAEGATHRSYITNDVELPTPSAPDENYVRTETFFTDNVKSVGDVYALDIPDKVTTYQYLDGLGRPTQHITVKASPNKRDIVLPYEYDPTTGRITT